MAETKVTVVATKHDTLDPYIKILQSRSNDMDISFSSYLKTDNNTNKEQEKEQEDVELSIFEARSYFSDDKGETKNLNGPRFSSVSSFTVENKASSEASWNSQTGLLGNKNLQESSRGSSKKGKRWFFRRRTCPCSSSKSVQVQETEPRITESKTGSDRVVLNRIVHHNHQTISSDPIRLTIPSNNVTRSIDYSTNRESRTPVSNFTFPTLNQTSQTSEKAKNPVKQVLSPIKPVPSPATPNGLTTEEEAASDGSSDLFEIESFSARPWAPPVPDLVRNSIDESLTEYGYEPSEASVTWSVTTAEPLSASIMAPNYARVSLPQSLAYGGFDKKKTGLLSCHSETSVMVNGGQRLIQPLKSVSVQDKVAEKVLCNNGSSKLSVTSRALL